MPFVTVGRENSAAIRIYYEDHGSGSPVVLVHGYALNGHSWEKQEAALLAAGHRVITYDRRGSGASSRPSTGYDFDTLADDLHVRLSRLDLCGVVLAGFAMGTGEVARYLAVRGPGRVKAAVLVAPLLPFLLKTHDNPDGLDRSVFDSLTARIAADRPAAMKDFLDRSYNIDLLGGDRAAEPVAERAGRLTRTGAGYAGVRRAWRGPAGASRAESNERPGSCAVPAGPPGSDGGTAAVSGDDRAGDVAGLGRGEEGDHAGDLAGVGGPGQQGRGAEGLDAFGGGSVGPDRRC